MRQTRSSNRSRDYGAAELDKLAELVERQNIDRVKLKTVFEKYQSKSSFEGQPLSDEFVQVASKHLGALLALFRVELLKRDPDIRDWIDQLLGAVERLSEVAERLPPAARSLFRPVLKADKDASLEIKHAIAKSFAELNRLLKPIKHFLDSRAGQRQGRPVGSLSLKVLLLPELERIWVELTGLPARNSRNRNGFDSFAEEVIEAIGLGNLKKRVRGQVRKIAARRAQE